MKPSRATIAGALLLLVSGFTLVALPSAAYGNWFGRTWSAGSCVGGNMTDDKNVSFVYSTANGESPSATLQSTTTFTRGLVNPTSYSTSLVSTQTSTTDVVMHDADYTSFCSVGWSQNGVTGVMGLTTCGSTTSGGRCQQAHVRLNVRFFNAQNTAADRWLSCHEIGHAIGLRHRQENAGCMVTCHVSTAAYSTHDLTAHLNAALNNAGDGTEPSC